MLLPDHNSMMGVWPKVYVWLLLPPRSDVIVVILSFAQPDCS